MKNITTSYMSQLVQNPSKKINRFFIKHENHKITKHSKTIQMAITLNTMYDTKV